MLNLKDVAVLIEIEGKGVKNEEIEGFAMIKEWVPLAPATSSTITAAMTTA